jgi:hypothetical protein
MWVSLSPVLCWEANGIIANRTLEDLDAYYRSNPPLIVVNDPDAISAKRPLKYIEHEDEELQKNTKRSMMKAGAVVEVESSTVEYLE